MKTLEEQTILAPYIEKLNTLWHSLKEYHEYMKLEPSKYGFKKPLTELKDIINEMADNEIR